MPWWEVGDSLVVVVVVVFFFQMHIRAMMAMMNIRTTITNNTTFICWVHFWYFFFFFFSPSRFYAFSIFWVFDTQTMRTCIFVLSCKTSMMHSIVSNSCLLFFRLFWICMSSNQRKLHISMFEWWTHIGTRRESSFEKVAWNLMAWVFSAFFFIESTEWNSPSNYFVINEKKAFPSNADQTKSTLETIIQLWHKTPFILSHFRARDMLNWW